VVGDAYVDVVGSAWDDVLIVVVIRRRRANIEQVSAKRELLGAVSAGKESVVTNAMRSCGRRFPDSPSSGS
jgi:hypothetical protein